MTSQGTKRKRDHKEEDEGEQEETKDNNNNPDKFCLKIRDIYTEFPEFEDFYDLEVWEFLAPLLPGHKKCPCCGCTDVKDASVRTDKVHVSVKKCAKGCYYWP